MRKLSSIALVSALLLLAAGAVANAQDLTYKLRKVAITGDASPIGKSYSSISFSDAPSINIKGEIAFIGAVDNEAANSHLFIASPAIARVIASLGSSTPIGKITSLS